jgi:hypothetical protein
MAPQPAAPGGQPIHSPVERAAIRHHAAMRFRTAGCSKSLPMCRPRTDLEPELARAAKHRADADRLASAAIAGSAFTLRAYVDGSDQELVHYRSTHL